MRLLLIGCSVLIRELSEAIVHSPHLIDAQYLAAGLHDSGAKAMRLRIQQAIDAADPSHYDAIVLGYALCGNGLAGLRARAVQLVLPRAHDCITLLMGGRARYAEYFHAQPGVYFRSAGWVERAAELEQQMTGMGFSTDLDALMEKYGEEAGRYLYRELTRYHSSYNKLTYIRTGSDVDASFVERARAEATEKNWAFEEMRGDTTLFSRLLAGDWSTDFLIVPPGHRSVATYDEDILAAVPCTGDDEK
jgi:hypothetical protein